MAPVKSGVFAFCFLFLITTFATAQQVRIMPLGNSITKGVGSTGNALSYRKELHKMLKATYSIDFVGSLNDGDGSFDQDHEGHPGFLASQVRSGISGWLAANPADMVLLHIGTNDVSEPRTTQSIVNDISAIMTAIWAAGSKTRIFLCSLIPRTDNLNPQTIELNAAILQLYNDSKGAHPITFVDQYAAITAYADWRTSLMWDEIHPNNSGYLIMAQAFYSALTEFLSPVTPVELVSFKATSGADGILLNWETASETNNFGFYVEHSFGGRPFEEIGFVAGAGTIASPQFYSYLHKPVEAGTHKYRLRQVDTDGTFAYSSEVEAQFTPPARFTLYASYPNPFFAGRDGAARISYDLAAGEDVRIAVLDVLGREVATLFQGNQPAGRHVLSWSGKTDTGLIAASGIYFIRLQTSHGVNLQRMQLIH